MNSTNIRNDFFGLGAGLPRVVTRTRISSDKKRRKESWLEQYRVQSTTPPRTPAMSWLDWKNLVVKLYVNRDLTSGRLVSKDEINVPVTFLAFTHLIYIYYMWPARTKWFLGRWGQSVLHWYWTVWYLIFHAQSAAKGQINGKQQTYIPTDHKYKFWFHSSSFEDWRNLGEMNLNVM